MVSIRQAARLLVPPPLRLGWELFAIVILVGIYTLLVAWLDETYQHGPITASDTQITLINGLIMGTLVGFRTNEASRRWWEARVIWGQLINDLRNLAMKSRALVAMSPGDRERWGKLLIAFAESLKNHLRGHGSLCELPGFANSTECPAHVPLHIAGLIQSEIVRWEREGKIDGMGLWLLDTHVRDLMNVCGGCERIRNTPLASSYRAMLHHGITLNTLMTPLFLVQVVGYWGAPIMAVISYFVLGIELIAVHIEEPFGLDGDDLPLESYCDTIHRSVHQSLELTDGSQPAG